MPGDVISVSNGSVARMLWDEKICARIGNVKNDDAALIEQILICQPSGLL